MSKELTQEHLDYAKMANDGYNDKFACGPGTDNPNYVVIDSINSKSGYDAVVYKNILTGELIISHRGTEFGVDGKQKDDLWADGLIAAGKTPEQIKDAQRFLEKIAKEHDINPNQIINTGHSLGGYISNYIGIKNGSKSISFDAPGFGGFDILRPVKLIENKIKKVIDNKVNKSDITNILASSNPINTVGYHVGITIRLGGLPSLMNSHSIDKIICKIESNVKPIQRTCKAEYVPQETPFGQGHVATLEACKGLLSVCSK